MREQLAMAWVTFVLGVCTLMGGFLLRRYVAWPSIWMISGLVAAVLGAIILLVYIGSCGLCVVTGERPGPPPPPH